MRRLSLSIRALLVLLLLLAAPTPLRAADYADRAALDQLFEQLKDARDAAEASGVAARIWSLWFHPGVPDLSGRMDRASAASGSGDLPGALSLLGGIVADYPDYAEGWNQRATLYYRLGNFDASLADIERVLALEPRHFGARSGRVMIYLQQGRRPEALREMIAALAIDPFLETRALFPELSPKTTNV